VTVSPGGNPVTLEAAPQAPDGEQISAPELPPATFLKQPRIDFSEMPPSVSQNRIGSFPLPPESAFARPVRVTPSPVKMDSPVQRRGLPDRVQQASGHTSKRVQPSGNSVKTLEAQAVAPPVASKMPQEKAALTVPAQQISVVPMHDTGSVRDSLTAISSPRRSGSWTEKKEEGGGLSIDNLEIQIIQEDAPVGLPTAQPPSPTLADDWDMDRRYVRHLG